MTFQWYLKLLTEFYRMRGLLRHYQYILFSHNSHVETLTSSTSEVAVFGDKAFREGIKSKQSPYKRESKIYFCSDIHPGVGLLDPMVILFLVFWRTPILLFKNYFLFNFGSVGSLLLHGLLITLASLAVEDGF